MYIIRMNYLLEQKWSTVNNTIKRNDEWNELYVSLFFKNSLDKYDNNVLYTKISLLEFEPIEMNIVNQNSLKIINEKISIPINYEIDIDISNLRKVKYGRKLSNKDICKIREMLIGNKYKLYTKYLTDKKLRDYHNGLINYNTFKVYNRNSDRIVEINDFLNKLYNNTIQLLKLG